MPEFDVGPLAEQMKGRVVVSGEPDWDDERQAYNTAVDQAAAFLALPESVEDVVAVVNFARENGLKVAPQRTGHNAEPLEPFDQLIMLNQKRRNAVSFDVEARSARVEAGAQWQDLVPLAAREGLAALHGSAPDIGIAGYTLGGGVGWYARKHGLAANRVTAVELVNAAGEQVRVDAESDPDLFWALRGGGGNFGIATALEFELLEIGDIYAGVLFFELERATEVLQTWNEWIATVPDEVTSVGRIMQFPPLPELPPELSGKSFALVEACFLGSEADGVEIMRPIRDLGAQIDTFEMRQPDALAELHMDPPDPLPYVGHHLLLNDLPSEAINAFVEAGGEGSGSNLISIELRQFGGALGRRPEGAGCLGAIEAPMFYFGVGMADTPEAEETTNASLKRVAGVLDPWDPGTFYYNFVEQHDDPRKCFEERAYERLLELRRRHDPDGLIRANHVIE